MLASVTMVNTTRFLGRRVAALEPRRLLMV
jgi:hypothetical protein